MGISGGPPIAAGLHLAESIERQKVEEAEMNGLSVLDETPRRGEEDGVFDAEQTAKILEDLSTFAEEEAARAEDKATIKFKARVWKVGSLGGGGLRVVLNLDQEYIRQMAMLAECQHDPEMELEFEARQAD